MIISTVTIVLFVIIFMALFHRYVTTTNISYPTKPSIAIIVLSIVTCLLVVKMLMEQILTAM